MALKTPRSTSFRRASGRDPLNSLSKACLRMASLWSNKRWMANLQISCSTFVSDMRDILSLTEQSMPQAVPKKLPSLPRRKAEFIEPMECALVPTLPEEPDWTYEVKLDGYRAIG